MAKIKNYNQFIEDVANRNFRRYVKRFQELAGIKKEPVKETYFIEISFDFDNTLLEHESIKNFKKSKNRYFFHAEKIIPPVRAHYHVISSKGNNEIYAVNMDGTAHHKRNRGYEIPKKEAEELRSLGVNIPSDRIIEHKDFLEDSLRQLLIESVKHPRFSIFIEIEE